MRSARVESGARLPARMMPFGVGRRGAGRWRPGFPALHRRPPGAAGKRVSRGESHQRCEGWAGERGEGCVCGGGAAGCGGAADAEMAVRDKRCMTPLRRRACALPSGGGVSAHLLGGWCQRGTAEACLVMAARAGESVGGCSAAAASKRTRRVRLCTEHGAIASGSAQRRA